MKSKKFCCNGTIVRHDLIRFWPLWGILLAVLQLRCVLPTVFLAVFGVKETDGIDEREILVANGIQNMYEAANPLIIVCVCIAAALLVFGYLFRKRETYMLHSFPVEKGQYFCSHFLSGLIMIAMPYAVTYFLTWVILALFGGNIIGIIGVILLEVLVMIVFFYTLSCLVVMLCGNAAISVIIYGVSNVLVGGFLLLANRAADFFINSAGACTLDSNVSGILDGVLSYATPINKFIQVFGAQGIFTGSKEGWHGMVIPWRQFGTMAWYMIPAVVFLAIAYILYQRRALERVGDTLAFPWGKPVFHWIFTICGSNLLTILLFGLGIIYLKEHLSTYRALFWAGMGCQLLSCVVCFIISNMILQRTFHVWKEISVACLGVCICCVLGVMLFARYSSYHMSVPDAEEVKSLQLQLSDYDTGRQTGTILVERKEEIRKIMESVQDIFDRAEDMPIENDDTVTEAEILCECGEKNYSFSVGYLEETYYKKEYETICSVLNNPDTMPEKIFSKEYQKLPENAFAFFLTDGEGMEEIDAPELNLHKKEVMQALEADIRDGAILLCGQEESERMLSISVNLKGHLQEPDRTSYWEEAAMADEDDTEEGYFGRTKLPLTSQCTHLIKLFEKWEIDTGIVYEMGR